MLDEQSRLRRKSEEVVAKVMDGEAIIINLATGVYYSLDNAGAAMWEMIEAGCRLDTIAAAIAARYEVASERAREDVLRLGHDLLREDLVDLSDGEAPPAPAVSGVTALAYTAPTLHAYRDMEDLLALDPPTPSLSEIPWKA